MIKTLWKTCCNNQSQQVMYSPVVIRLHEEIKPTSVLRSVQVTDWVKYRKPDNGHTQRWPEPEMSVPR